MCACVCVHVYMCVHVCACVGVRVVLHIPLDVLLNIVVCVTLRVMMSFFVPPMQCSHGCQGGFRFRSVLCQVPMNFKTRPDSDCSALIKPTSFNFCPYICKESPCIDSGDTPA